MPEYEGDPAGNTQQFRAYVNRDAGEPAAKSGSAALIAGVALVVVIVAVVTGLALVVL
jgi:preprotein translocase subunit SecD